MYLKDELCRLDNFEYTSSSNNMDVVNRIKETQCYVAQDFDAELKNASDQSSVKVTYKLPKGEIELDKQRIEVPELLFQPSKNGKTFDGIHKSTHDSIMK